ncbi:hypothetical protein ACFP3Q_04450 [Nocardioides sp. GCM10027113]|uniref:hypothetical protein n=1 Tax=unclassified Nocardioides TaxID=2615069 RepID=UPI00360CEDBE
MTSEPGTDPLLSEADELYGLRLADFTPARDARAKELKPRDADLAARVRALRKPSLAAWLANVLVRHDTEQVEQVLAVGEALREAQAAMSGEELRALTRQRRQLTAAVTTRARGVAAELGQRVTQAVADQVEATLTAAMLDAGCAGALRSGLLVQPLAATGVDEVDLGAAVAVPEALGFRASPREVEPPPRPDLHVVPDPDADAKVLQEAEGALAELEEALAEAREALEAATTDVSALQARELQVQAELDELRNRIAALEATMEEVEDELADAEDVRAEAEGAVLAATKERDEAAARVARLRG